MPALSPSDLRHRILVKGKVKVHAARSIVRCTSSASLALFGSRMSAGSRRSGEAQPEPARGVSRRSGEEQPEPARGASESERLTETPEATRDTLLRTSGSSSNLQRFSSTASRWSHSSDTEFVHTMVRATSDHACLSDPSTLACQIRPRLLAGMMCALIFHARSPIPSPLQMLGDRRQRPDQSCARRVEDRASHPDRVRGLVPRRQTNSTPSSSVCVVSRSQSFCRGRRGSSQSPQSLKIGCSQHSACPWPSAH